MAAAGASSISVTVRVRPFTIREAAQVTRRDDQTLFLGDGSLAGLPTPKVNSKGIRPVIKVLDEKCLYGQLLSSEVPRPNTMSESSTHRKTTQCSDSDDRPSDPRASVRRTRRLASTACSTTQPPKAMYTKRLRSRCWTACWTDTMRPSSRMAPRAAERHTQSRRSTYTA
jgi:hypothetical protein